MLSFAFLTFAFGLLLLSHLLPGRWVQGIIKRYNYERYIAESLQCVTVGGSFILNGEAKLVSLDT